MIQHEEEDESDDDMCDKEDDNPWLNIGTSKEEKKTARKPWKLSVIIKFVGKMIGYQYLFHRLQLLWRPQGTMSLIDLPNGFFIARFSQRSD